MIGCAVGDERWTHLTIGKPHRSDGCTNADHLFGNDDPFDRGTLLAAVLLRPSHADPAFFGHAAGKRLREPIDPAVVKAAMFGDTFSGDLAGPLLQLLQFWTEFKFHGANLGATTSHAAAEPQRYGPWKHRGLLAGARRVS